VTDPLSTVQFESEHKAVVVRPRPEAGRVAMFQTMTDFLLDNEPDQP